MVRPKKPRQVSFDPNVTYFKPRAIPLSELEEVDLDVDELEALRLCDRDGLTQEEAGLKMGVSRGTIQRIITIARRKTAEALSEGRALVFVDDE